MLHYTAGMVTKNKSLRIDDDAYDAARLVAHRRFLALADLTVQLYAREVEAEGLTVPEAARIWREAHPPKASV